MSLHSSRQGLVKPKPLFISTLLLPITPSPHVASYMFGQVIRVLPPRDPEQPIPDSMKELARRMDNDRLREAVVVPSLPAT